MRIPLVIEPGTDGNLWAINGKSYPQTDPFCCIAERATGWCSTTGAAWIIRSTCTGTPWNWSLARASRSRGIGKDVVLVPAHQTVEADVVARSPGPSLFHCHQQFHMDFGFMALMRYSE